MTNETDSVESARRILAMVLVAVAVLLVAWFARQIVLIVFAGVLAAVFFSGGARLLGRWIPLSHGWLLAIFTVALLAVATVAVLLLAPRIGGQIDELSQALPQAFERLQAQLQDYGWGRRLLDRVPSFEELAGALPSMAPRALGVFATTLGVLANLVVVLFIGLYGAAEPETYEGGLVRLVPPKRRDRAREVLSQLVETLRWWLVGRFFSMVVIGVLSALGLWLLGVRLALSLGLLAGILSFVPYIGPIVAAVPAVLLGFLDGPRAALYVVLLYLGVQIVESYLLTPLVERRTVHLPPALTISTQLLATFLAGFLGLFFASPLTAAGMVLVRTLYVEDALGDES